MPLSVLLVDDSPSARMSLEAVLCEDFEVTTVGSAAEALAVLEKSVFNLLVADQQMPEMTGLQLLGSAAVKKLKIARVLLTGAPDELDANGEDITILSKATPPARLIRLLSLLARSAPGDGG